MSKDERKIKEFTELLQIHEGIAYKIACMYCSNNDCWNDLFQDILLQLWIAFPNYDNKRKFSTWMYRIALNTAISQLRKNSKLEITKNIPEHIEDDNIFYFDKEEITLLYKAISKLNKVEKAIIILYLDDNSYEEISEVIGISLSNVGVKINRIKMKLREILKEF